MNEAASISRVPAPSVQQPFPLPGLRIALSLVYDERMVVPQNAQAHARFLKPDDIIAHHVPYYGVITHVRML